MIEFWTGNPSNDIWHGHMLINPVNDVNKNQSQGA